MTRQDYSTQDHPPLAPILAALASIPVVFVVIVGIALFWFGTR